MDLKGIRKARTQEELSRRTFEFLKELAAAGRPTDSRSIIELVVDRLLAKQMPRDEAVAALLWESGRGGRALVVDENIEWLERALSEKNYTSEPTPRGAGDKRIKQNLCGKVFITRNGANFAKPADMENFAYGLVWIQTASDDQLADKVEAAPGVEFRGKSDAGGDAVIFLSRRNEGGRVQPPS